MFGALPLAACTPHAKGKAFQRVLVKPIVAKAKICTAADEFVPLSGFQSSNSADFIGHIANFLCQRGGEALAGILRFTAQQRAMIHQSY
jgi:hypothetical protein